MGQKLVRPLGGRNFINLSATDRAVEHLYEHLADAEGFGKIDLVDNKRLPRLREDCRLGCLDLHAFRLFEIDELVITAIAKMVVKPNPLRRMQDRLCSECPAF